MASNKITLILFGTVLLSSCATYYQTNRAFNRNFEQGRFEKAEKALKDNQKAARGKARFLHYANLGVVNSLQGEYEKSNEYLEKAYIFGEDYRKNYFNEVLSYLYNPTALTYPGEDHEHLIVLYYKALNYLQLQAYEKALVECRRLNIRLQELSDKYKSDKKYKRDAFIHTLMGLIYDADKDYNNAFIAYRNAYTIYDEDYRELFGLEPPLQLKKDILRTARLSGFYDDVRHFEEKFGMQYEPREKSDGEVVFFWNNGLGPVKAEWGINFALTRKGGGVVFVNDEYGLSFPFQTASLSEDESHALSSVEFIRVAFPRYVERPPLYVEADIQVGGNTYPLELAEDINAIAFKTLNERMIAELGKALLRFAIKKGAENLARKEDEGFGALVGFLNALTEKADTRNWQSIPHSIYYTRIPLPEGEHTLTFNPVAAGNRQVGRPFEFTFHVNRGQMLFHSFHSLETAPGNYYAY